MPEKSKTSKVEGIRRASNKVAAALTRAPQSLDSMLTEEKVDWGLQPCMTFELLAQDMNKSNEPTELVHLTFDEYMTLKGTLAVLRGRSDHSIAKDALQRIASLKPRKEAA